MIIIFGPAGSGKSTQGQKLAEEFGWKWLSVGQVLRNAGGFERTLAEGKLVDDDVAIELMAREMERADADGKNLIVDGYPRNAYQARWAAGHIAGKIEGMIVLEVPKEELFRRLEARGRTDDAEREVIERRWGIYEREIAEILEILAGCGVPRRDVEALGTVEEVSERLREVVRELVPMASLQRDDVNGDEIEKSYGE